MGLIESVHYSMEANFPKVSNLGEEALKAETGTFLQPAIPSGISSLQLPLLKRASESSLYSRVRDADIEDLEGIAAAVGGEPVGLTV